MTSSPAPYMTTSRELGRRFLQGIQFAVELLGAGVGCSALRRSATLPAPASFPIHLLHHAPGLR